MRAMNSAGRLARPQRHRPPSKGEGATTVGAARDADRGSSRQECKREIGTTFAKAQAGNSRSVAVYDGRHRIGSIVESAPHAFLAFDAEDALIGTYTTMRSAADSISRAFQIDGGAA